MFMLNLKALLKKKFLIQVRDQRTFVLELLFPIIFIFVGLALATNKPIKAGIPRLMSPSIFPEPSHLYYNNIVPTQNLLSSDFFTKDFTESFWDEKRV